DLEPLLAAFDRRPRAADPQERMVLGVEHGLAQHVPARARDVVVGRRAVELVAFLRSELRVVDDELLDRNLHLEARLLELGMHEDLACQATDRDDVVMTEALRDRALALVNEP